MESDDIERGVFGWSSSSSNDVTLPLPRSCCGWLRSGSEPAEPLLPRRFARGVKWLRLQRKGGQEAATKGHT